jgi:hypothetical protein
MVFHFIGLRLLLADRNGVIGALCILLGNFCPAKLQGSITWSAPLLKAIFATRPRH